MQIIIFTKLLIACIHVLHWNSRINVLVIMLLVFVNLTVMLVINICVSLRQNALS